MADENQQPKPEEKPEDKPDDRYERRFAKYQKRWKSIFENPPPRPFSRKRRTR